MTVEPADDDASQLGAALESLNSGQARQAEHICKSLLRRSSISAAVHHVLALSYRAQGKLIDGEMAVKKALEIAPDEPSALNTLGLLLLEQDQPEAAIGIFKKILQKTKTHIAACTNLAHATAKLNDTAGAEGYYRTALEMDPNWEDAFVHLALLLQTQGRLCDLNVRFPTVEPEQPGLLLVKGLIALDNNSPLDAEKIFKTGIKLSPQSAVLWGNLGIALSKQHNTSAARSAYENALKLDPQLAEVKLNFADLIKYDEPEMAQSLLKDALILEPKNANTLDMMGFTYFLTGDMETALRFYNQSIAVDPTFFRARAHRSGVHFVQGFFAAAWRDYNKRHSQPPHLDSPVDAPLPLMSEQNLPGENTLVWTDQGLGDEILQLGLIADVYEKELGFTLVTNDRLKPIVKRSFPNMNCIGREEIKKRVGATLNLDEQCPATFLGRKLRGSFTDFPHRLYYLKADEQTSSSLRRRYTKDQPSKTLVGISWKSSNAQFGDKKSVTIDQYLPLLEGTNCTFVVLQYGAVIEEIDALPANLRARIIIDDDIDPLTDMDAFASQVNAMDVVVTTSNTTAHMAGALGKPTWALVPKVGRGWLWYWFTDRDDSPWYPSMRIVRQADDGTWAAAVSRVTDGISSFLK